MLELTGIHHAYEGKPVLRGVGLRVLSGEIICLLGPSGCGKTTLLRIAAGLETANQGEVRFNGEDITQQPPHARHFGLMFQDYALFPHLNVAQNVAFGLLMQQMPRRAQLERVREVLSLVGLEAFAQRDIAQLSGGERQRVALARSLAPQPRLLMLDEPLSALDAALRDHLAVELRTIIKSVGLPTLYVTHDQREAFAVADRAAIMNNGHIIQFDTPEALYHRPASAFAARFLGMGNLIPVKGCKNGTAITAVGAFPVDGDAKLLLAHPRGLRLSDSGVPARVRERIFLGDTFRVTVECADGILLRFKDAGAAMTAVGDGVQVVIDANGVFPINPD
jgi:ABC-type Fe3+/spermidine/putrescine transport system ATPase subunit